MNSLKHMTFWKLQFPLGSHFRLNWGNFGWKFIVNIQSDWMLKSHINDDKFWRLLDINEYLPGKNVALMINSYWGSISLCEILFSTMKCIKTKCRWRLTDIHLVLHPPLEAGGRHAVWSDTIVMFISMYLWWPLFRILEYIHYDPNIVFALSLYAYSIKSFLGGLKDYLSWCPVSLPQISMSFFSTKRLRTHALDFFFFLLNKVRIVHRLSLGKKCISKSAYSLFCSWNVRLEVRGLFECKWNMGQWVRGLYENWEPRLSPRLYVAHIFLTFSHPSLVHHTHKDPAKKLS